MPIGEPMKKTIYRFLTAFYKIKKIYFLPRGAPCSAGAVGLGLAGLCLKTALSQTDALSVNFSSRKKVYVLGRVYRTRKLADIDNDNDNDNNDNDDVRVDDG